MSRVSATPTRRLCGHTELAWWRCGVDVDIAKGFHGRWRVEREVSVRHDIFEFTEE